jgi:ABC-type glycerol-3-phosphate transport system permease component
VKRSRWQLLNKNVNKGFIYVIVALGAIITTVPFLYMVSTSLKKHAYSVQFQPGLIPQNPTTVNFTDAWDLSNFQLYFRNSLFVALTSVVLVVLVSSMMAYAFARFKFPGKEIIFFAILIVLMVPNMVGLIPQFLLAKALGLRNSLIGLILFYVAGMVPFNTFLLRGFIESLPKELEDAVLIDGGSYFTVYRTVILPLSTPALATVAIFSFLGFWDEFILALTFIDDPAKRTLPIAIALLHGQYGTDWGLVFAASLIAVVPVIAVFLALQKYFVGGLTSGAFR